MFICFLEPYPRPLFVFAAKAKKCLETLQEARCKEAIILQNRIAKLEAACKLFSTDLSNFKRIELTQIWAVLKEEQHEIPSILKMATAARAITWKLDDIFSVQAQHHAEAYDQLEMKFRDVFLLICFWTPGALDLEEELVGVMDVAKPSLLPLIGGIVKQDKLDARLDDLEDDEDENVKSSTKVREERWEAGTFSQLTRPRS